MIRIVVTIGWLYVVVLMAATQDGWLAALGTLVFYALLPLGILLYVLGAPARGRRRRAAEAREAPAAASRGSGVAAEVGTSATPGASAARDPD